MVIKRWHIISKIINDKHLSIGAEVGVQAGQNIKEILLRCPNFNFLAIDCWDPQFKYQTWPKEIQRENEKSFDEIAALYPLQIKKLKGYSSVVAPLIADHSLDLVFLDASHGYDSVRQDILAWLPKILQPGFIGGHDYGHPKFPGVKKAVDESFKKISLHLDFVWFAEV